ncbi:Aste57867_24006 [Aphanomyces stellatus]|uniref:Aste57867_24006 protein n=1 Tax=Aphanomyces stellatus TaxID=120398 RepID=A0A485LQ00_9STRA|nr:hypothetical protein As57867_023933 [Aphanomyces stellatus]VFU00649.1 Aste57867_24006 [Aphanomyces stellatus]
MWDSKPEGIDAETSPSLLCNNLSIAKDIMVFAHLEDVVVVNPKATGKTTNKITLVEKAIVYQVVVCDMGGELYLVIATESGCQVWDVLGEHLHYSLSLAKELEPSTDLQLHFCRGIANDDKAIFIGSSAPKLFTLALEAGQSKGQSEFSLHTTATADVHHDPIHALATPRGETRASVLCSADDDGVVVIWSLENAPQMEVKHKLKATGFPVTTVKCMDSEWCVTGDVTGKLRLVNVHGGFVAADVGAHTRNLSALDMVDNVVVTVGEDGYMHVWKLKEQNGRLKVSLVHSHRVGDDILTGVAFVSAQSIVTSSYDVNHLKSWKAL